MSGEISMYIQAMINGLLLGGVFSLITVGLSLVYGVMKIINFAHGELLMLGMYFTLTASTLLGFGPYLSLLICVPCMFFIGVLVQQYLIEPVLDEPHEVQIFLTLGLSLVLTNIALLIWGPDYQSVKTSYMYEIIRLGPINIGLARLGAFLFSLFGTGVIYFLLKWTTLGKAIRASSDNKVGALLVGINVKRIYLITFGIGTVCAAAAGSIITPFYSIHPYIGLVFVLNAFIIVVLGGMGSIIGSFLAAMIICILGSLAALFMPPGFKEISVFAIFIFIIIVRPQGLLGEKEN